MSIQERHNMLIALRDMGIPSVGYHLDKWWDLPRADQLPVEPFFRVDHLFTADGGHDQDFADLGINHYWLPPAIYHGEAVLGTPRQEFKTDLAFVGSWQGHYHPEWQHRFDLVNFLRDNYGDRCAFYPMEGHRQVRGEMLSDLYASVKVVVGDSCMLGPRYISDRIPETIGRGGFLIHPCVADVTTGEYWQSGQHLMCWPLGDWGRLKEMIDFCLADASLREYVRNTGYLHTKTLHTYRNRLQSVLDTVFPDA